MSDLLYPFPAPLVHATLIKRYKRFFIDASLPDGTIVTAHTPNTGSMMGLIEPGRQVVLTYHPSPTRKLAYTLQAILCGDTWVGCNTHIPNAATEQAILTGQIPALAGYGICRREVPYGQDKRSRIDMLLQNSTNGQPDAFIEVKNVTLRVGDDVCFPDAVTERGLKHLHELMDIRSQGHRAVMVFFTQRNDCKQFRVAHEIDPAYAQAFETAQAKGVEAIVLHLQVTPAGIALQTLQ